MTNPLDPMLLDANQAHQSEHWRIAKEIPVAMIVALMLQTGAGIAWLSNLSFKIDSAIQQLAEFKSDRYTKDDARKDRELVLQIIDGLRQRDAEHERRIEVMERAAKTATIPMR